jgi:polyisoprenoid-binding protein YceI
MRKLIIGVAALAALAACSQKPAATSEPAAPALSATLGTDAPAGVYKLDNTHASITWKVMHFGLAKYTARFTKWDAELNFDPADPAKNSVSVKIDPNSVRTDYPYAKTKSPMGTIEDFDKKIATDPKMLNSKKFPEITFKSTAVERTGDKSAKVTGDLTMLGVTKPITIDATFNSGMAAHPFTKAPVVGFSGAGTIKRSEFGFTEGAPYLGDDVDLLIEAEFDGPVPAAPAAAAPK